MNQIASYELQISWNAWTVVMNKLIPIPGFHHAFIASYSNTYISSHLLESWHPK